MRHTNDYPGHNFPSFKKTQDCSKAAMVFLWRGFARQNPQITVGGRVNAPFASRKNDRAGMALVYSKRPALRFRI
jgi:hypothetical protein